MNGRGLIFCLWHNVTSLRVLKMIKIVDEKVFEEELSGDKIFALKVVLRLLQEIILKKRNFSAKKCVKKCSFLTKVL